MANKPEPVINWNLGALYNGLNDPKLMADVAALERAYTDFMKYRGHVAENLDSALRDYTEIVKLSDGIFPYLYMIGSVDNENQEIKKVSSAIEERITRVSSDLAFWDIEIANMTDAQLKKWENNPTFIANKAYVDNVRKNQKYLLSESEETLLGKLSPYGVSEWDNMLDELESGLRFKIKGKECTLPQALNILMFDKNRDIRRAALVEINTKLKDSNHAFIRARALNVLAGEKNTLDQIRGYTHIMQAKNIENNLSDDAVNALHTAVQTHGVKQAQRYYNIVAKMMGVRKLNWSDRTTNPATSKKEFISWDAAKQIVLDGYAKFSPTMYKYAIKMFDENRIDANVKPGKSHGAYSYSFVTPTGPQSYIMMNMQNDDNSVSTLAHELGHSIHGYLAMNKQAPLVVDAPTAYCETASIFGEMLTFQSLLGKSNDEQKISLLMKKSLDWINTVVRQIDFSEFEKWLHTKRKDGKVSLDEIATAYKNISKKSYGNKFDYKNMEYMWSYIGHFMRPFYVYSYAFGELFVQSLYAHKDTVPDFEKKFIAMLESGGTKSAVELMAPFGLNPNDPEFWKRGIDVSITKWLDNVEKLLQNTHQKSKVTTAQQKMANAQKQIARTTVQNKKR